jgi:hypothetical protein
VLLELEQLLGVYPAVFLNSEEVTSSATPSELMGNHSYLMACDVASNFRMHFTTSLLLQDSLPSIDWEHVEAEAENANPERITPAINIKDLFMAHSLFRFRKHRLQFGEAIGVFSNLTAFWTTGNYSLVISSFHMVI